MMYINNDVPVTILNVPSANAKATPIATVTRSPHWFIVPAETSSAFIATAISEGSAIVVEKPINAEKYISSNTTTSLMVHLMWFQ